MIKGLKRLIAVSLTAALLSTVMTVPAFATKATAGMPGLKQSGAVSGDTVTYNGGLYMYNNNRIAVKFDTDIGAATPALFTLTNSSGEIFPVSKVDYDAETTTAKLNIYKKLAQGSYTLTVAETETTNSATFSFEVREAVLYENAAYDSTNPWNENLFKYPLTETLEVDFDLRFNYDAATALNLGYDTAKGIQETAIAVISKSANNLHLYTHATNHSTSRCDNAFKENAVNKMRNVVDIDGRGMAVYIDGVKKTDDNGQWQTRKVAADATMINTIQLNKGSKEDITNLKIFAYGDAVAITPKADTTTAEVELCDNITGFPAEGYKVTNLFTGEKDEAATAARTASGKLTITSALTFKTGYSYKIEIPNGITTTNNLAPTETSYEVYVGGNGYIKGIKLKDCYDAEHYIKTENNPSVVKTISLWFANASVAQAAADATLDNGLTVASATTPNADSTGLYRTDITLSGYFTGNTNYTLTIPAEDGLSMAYSLPISVGDGQFLIKSVKAEKVVPGEPVTYTPIASLSELSAGDDVRVTYELIKTIPGAKSAVISSTVWNGLDLSNFAYSPASMTESETEKTAYLTIKVASLTNAKLKAYLWKGVTDINPLSTEFVIN